MGFEIIRQQLSILAPQSYGNIPEGLWAWELENMEEVAVVSHKCIRPAIPQSVLEGITPKNCYANALKIANSLPGSKIVIGQGVDNEVPLPLDHVWISIDGLYIDPTWEEFASGIEKYTYVKFVEMSPSIFATLCVDVEWMDRVIMEYYTRYVLSRKGEHNA